LYIKGEAVYSLRSSKDQAEYFRDTRLKVSRAPYLVSDIRSVEPEVHSRLKTRSARLRYVLRIETDEIAPARKTIQHHAHQRAVVFLRLAGVWDEDSLPGGLRVCGPVCDGVRGGVGLECPRSLTP